MEQRLHGAQIMICLICRQAELVPGFTHVKFERGEIKLVVNNVPARACPACGEAYVDQDVAMQLLRGAEERSSMGLIDSTMEYEPV
jgi:YgiT-type zinc finger domain-containing protein